MSSLNLLSINLWPLFLVTLRGAWGEQGLAHSPLVPPDLCMNIIGGQDVIPHSKPFMALIRSRKEYCGGSLIKKNWVLTAAHCQIKGAKVILGAHSISKSEKEKQLFKIAKRIPYPCFDGANKENDLMLLQLKGRVKINKAVKTTNLPNTGTDIKAGTRCQVIGWGTTNNGINKPSDTLKEVNVTVIDRNTCNDKKHYNLQPAITKNMVCAGDVKGGKDSCSGDSGGPLICNGELKGITSFGKNGQCGVVQYPGVYTLLTTSYINWIKKTIGGDLEDDFFAD
ncbi:granzyme A isoform X2 [Alligator mississippiensis]|uniref:granzyme A isoform X2 n=1 Tax=Alligator mississippiensis TaxID=8496 RepID=UPI002877843E|nr:granzyme A isoform X2 [Alligator mississippiensis]